MRSKSRTVLVFLATWLLLLPSRTDALSQNAQPGHGQPQNHGQNHEQHKHISLREAISSKDKHRSDEFILEKPYELRITRLYDDSDSNVPPITVPHKDEKLDRYTRVCYMDPEWRVHHSTHEPSSAGAPPVHHGPAVPVLMSAGGSGRTIVPLTYVHSVPGFEKLKAMGSEIEFVTALGKGYSFKAWGSPGKMNTTTAWQIFTQERDGTVRAMHILIYIRQSGNDWLVTKRKISEGVLKPVE